MKASDITYSQKLSELRLDISNPNSKRMSYLFLEGDTDVRLFRKFINLDDCKVERIPGGNVKLEECVDTLLPIHSLVFAVRDADFIRITDPSYAKPNIILTDCHDIEMTMLSVGESLAVILSEYTMMAEDKCKQVYYKLMNTILPVSLLRLLNEKESVGFNFKSGFQDLLKFDDETMSLPDFLHRILCKSKDATLTNKEKIMDKVLVLSEQHHDLQQLTSGHDLLNALATYLKEKFQHKGLSGQDLERNLRISFHLNSFQQTQIYQSIQDWERDNGVRVLS